MCQEDFYHGLLGGVDAQALLPGGDLIVGGQVGSAGGVPVGNIARYNFGANAWLALGSGVNGQVTALAVIPGGDLIVGGYFSVAGGVTRRAVARYRPATNTWSTLGTGLAGGTPGSPLSVHALLSLPSGDVLVTGSFNSAGGMPASNIALYNPTLNTWSALGAGLISEASIVFGLLLLPGGDVIVAGQFDHAGGAVANNIARYSFGAPGISAQPQNAIGCALGSAAFTVTAAGTGPFTYQWHQNSTPIDTIANPSAATATLSLTNIEPADAGSYDCIVTNTCGSVTSDSATLSICDNVADLNCNGSVGLPDLTVLLAHFGTQSGATHADGDLNADGDVDLSDLTILLSRFGTTCP